MVSIPIRELGTTTLRKMRVLTREAGQPWRILEDDIIEPIRWEDPEVIHEPTFARHQRPRHVEPDYPKHTLGDVMRSLTIARGAALDDELACRGDTVYGDGHLPFPGADHIVPPPS
ncbi:unnamed protein product [Lactuca saligna]|uniref:Uncharacterized protein n=1 Tax=Lactuca saligna TaxID=75948 RepID=A0AA36DVD1_LACSI|nr:unnamed protein product [Lactuca saligna]